MSGLILTLLVALVFIIIYQIAQAGELTSVLRGEENVKHKTNRIIAILLVAFFVLGIWGIWECHEMLIDKMLPVSASEHGVKYDLMLEMTLWVTGIVFFITQAILFWFAWKYQSSEKRNTAFFYPHNNKLELVWTTIPAIAMAILVAFGLKNWMTMTDEAPKDAQVVEVVGKQFNWIMRYPGADGVLGKRDFRNINDADNILGLDWEDKSNNDDVVIQNELHLIKGKPVKLIIGSRDVIHDVGLPHFRMKMDAVPGIITTIWFTPQYTTEEMKEITNNPDFVYEISCDQMCGKGHYSMRGIVIVHTQKEYDAWMAEQKSYKALNSADVAEEAATEATTEEKTDSVNAITMK